MADTRVWIGIDGGGTKTKAYLIDAEKKLVAETSVSSSNQNSVGFEGATRALTEACEILMSNRSKNSLVGICAGLSGCDRENDKVQFTAFFKSLYPHAEIQMYNDGVLALTSGTEGKLHGIVIISGTGSIAVGFHEKKGRVQYRASGWGPLLGEEGGGAMMGNDCLIAVAREADGRGPKTLLTPLVLERLSLTKAEDIIAWRYADASFARPATMAPLLYQAAKQKDEVALKLLAKSVHGLCESVESVHRRLEFSADEKVVVVAAGGNFTHEGSVLLDAFRSEITKRIPSAEVVLPSVDPAMAAALLAYNGV